MKNLFKALNSLIKKPFLTDLSRSWDCGESRGKKYIDSQKRNPFKLTNLMYLNSQNVSAKYIREQNNEM